MELKHKIEKINSKIRYSDFVVLKELDNFSNGIGYIQHDVDEINDITKEVILLANDNGYYTTNKTLLEETLKLVKDENFRQYSIVGRYFYSNIFSNIWYRLTRIDYKGREFGQTYFSIHPEKAKLVKLNKHFRKEIINKLLD